MKHEWEEQLQTRIERLIEVARDLKKENNELRTQLSASDVKADESEATIHEAPIQDEQNEELESLRKRCEKLESQLIQEEERFRIEYTLLQQRYEQNIARLNQMLAMQQAVKTTAHHHEELEQMRQKVQKSASIANELAMQLAQIAGEKK